MKRRMLTRRSVIGAMGVMTGSTILAGCGSPSDTSATSSGSTETTAPSQIDDVTIYVKGYEWGPGVPKLIIDLGTEAAEVTARVADFTVTTAGSDRVVTDAYLCDGTGTKVTGASRLLAIDMETTHTVSGSPFTYSTVDFMNHWSESYNVTIKNLNFAMDGAAHALDVAGDCIAHRLCPDTDLFTMKDTFSGTYTNTLTGKDEEVTLQRAAYEPEALRGIGGAPLMIWLHGQGEGGTDIDIELLGNEVTALAREEIQSHFSTGNIQGAFVLAVQCPTYWMDEGDGTNGNGSGVSRYTYALMDAIEDYVSGNTDIDRTRIYLGGCSNGGYMSWNMLVNFPDYWAAAYPQCEAYSYHEWERNEDGSYKQVDDPSNTMTGKAFVETDEVWFTDEKARSLAAIPIWMALSIDDPTVNPTKYGLPDYQALLKNGADNAWISVFETVQGTDDPATTYEGHWIWVNLFNDRITAAQHPSDVLGSTDTTTFGTIPSNDGGGTVAPQGMSNVFEWLNIQKRA